MLASALVHFIRSQRIVYYVFSYTGWAVSKRAMSFLNFFVVHHALDLIFFSYIPDDINERCNIPTFSNKLLHLDFVHMVHLSFISSSMYSINMRLRSRCTEKKSKQYFVHLLITHLVYTNPTHHIEYISPNILFMYNRLFLYFLFSLYNI